MTPMVWVVGRAEGRGGNVIHSLPPFFSGFRKSFQACPPPNSPDRQVCKAPPTSPGRFGEVGKKSAENWASNAPTSPRPTSPPPYREKNGGEVEPPFFPPLPCNLAESLRRGSARLARLEKWDGEAGLYARCVYKTQRFYWKPRLSKLSWPEKRRGPKKCLPWVADLKLFGGWSGNFANLADLAKTAWRGCSRCTTVARRACQHGSANA